MADVSLMVHVDHGRYFRQRVRVVILKGIVSWVSKFLLPKHIGVACSRLLYPMNFLVAGLRERQLNKQHIERNH